MVGGKGRPGRSGLKSGQRTGRIALGTSKPDGRADHRAGELHIELEVPIHEPMESAMPMNH